MNVVANYHGSNLLISILALELTEKLTSTLSLRVMVPLYFYFCHTFSLAMILSTHLVRDLSVLRLVKYVRFSFRLDGANDFQLAYILL